MVKFNVNRKSQVEIMGLVVIMIIISLVLLFVVSIVFKQDPGTEFSEAHGDL